MIRREAGRKWVLISQVDHAHLAGDLAEAWGAEPFEPLAAELVAGVRHHDDGWAQWERAPKVDPELGRPIAFTEMKLDDALSIWRTSIESARQLGHLAGYAVAGHFSALLQRYGSWQKHAADKALALNFLAECEHKMTEWGHAWQAADPAHRDDGSLARAVVFLQLFDALSLWLCMAPRSEPQTFEPPTGPSVTVVPATAETFGVRPWPFRDARLELAVPGDRIAIAHYGSAADLAAAPSERVVLRFNFAPG